MNLTEQECYLWRNILFESKIYKTATEKKVVAGELSRAVLCHLEL